MVNGYAMLKMMRQNSRKQTKAPRMLPMVERSSLLVSLLPLLPQQLLLLLLLLATVVVVIGLERGSHGLSCGDA